MTADLGRRLVRAERFLRSAQLLLDAGDPESAINRAYYAVHEAAVAALEADKLPPPKTHSGLISKFAGTFVATRRFPGDVFKALSRLEQQRLLVDYVGDANVTGSVPSLIADAAGFVAAVQRLLGGDPAPKELPGRPVPK